MKNKIQLVALILLAVSIMVVVPMLPSTSNETVPNDVPQSLNTLIITEVVTKNSNIISDEEGDYPDYVEIYNTGDAPIPLKGYGLSDEPSVPLKWTFPDVEIAPNSYLLVYASGKNKHTENIHTSFKLNENGDRLALSTPSGQMIQVLPLGDSTENMSYSLNEKGTYVYYTTGTPGLANEGITIEDLKAYKKEYVIAFSREAGFYEDEMAVALTVPNKGVSIRYTLNGEDPTGSSPIYEAPIVVKSRSLDPLIYANIPSTFNQNIKPSFTDVFKGTVLKAQAFLGDVPMGEIVTNTYFITPLGSERYTLPVVSLTTDPYHFFDDEVGIYVVGSKFQAQAPEYTDGSTPANYNQRGREWERPIHLEYFDADGQQVFEQNLGARTLGGWSRAYPKKSFKLFSRNSYQEDAATMDYPFFKDLTTPDGTPIESFNRLLLRNGGNDWEFAIFRDPLMQSLVPDSLATQADQPVILFLNGEYWGIYFLNETLDEYYVSSHYGFDKDDVSIMTITSHNDHEVYVGIEEDQIYFDHMMTFLEENDISLQENYDYINTLIDTDNLIDYYVAQIYFCNTDWPGNNMKMWRKRTLGYEPNAPYGQDGRYRYLLYDTDFGFGLYEGLSQWNHKTLEFAATESGADWPNPESATLIFRSLLKNNTFKQKFINAFADDLNTRYDTEAVLSAIDDYTDLLKPEVDEYAKRWQMWAIPNKETWESQPLQALRNFAKKRPNFLRMDAMDYFGLESAFDLNLDLNAPEGGTVLINNRITAFETADLTTFSGIYFSSVPVTLEAKPNKGFRFVGWSGGIESSESWIETTLTSDLQITAHFEKE